jgi:hypothetical protein
MSERGLGGISSRYDRTLLSCACGGDYRPYAEASPILNTNSHLGLVVP